MLAPLHSEEHEKYLFKLLPLDGIMEDLLVTACPYDQWATVKRRKGDYALFSILFNILQNVLSKRVVF